MKTKILGLLAVAMFMATPAHAFSVTLDNANPTVVRPTSGNVVFDFTGTVQYEPGETWSGFSFGAASMGVNAIGGVAICPGLICTNGGSGLLFSVLITPSKPLGLYTNGGFSVTATLPSGSRQTISTPWTVNLVSSVPEPGTLALLGLGLAGLGVSRRRKAATSGWSA